MHTHEDLGPLAGDQSERGLADIISKAIQAGSPSEAERAFAHSLVSGFIDARANADPRFEPRLLTNDKASSTNVLTSLEGELSRCDRFDISVAFVTKDGVTVLLKSLIALERAQVPGRVLVSTYLGFNDPSALDRLRRFANIELRAYMGPLHSKGYLFHSSGPNTLVVGSSNLTQSALLVNDEWNLLVSAHENGTLWERATHEFERLWHDSATHVVDDAWLADYARAFEGPASAQPRPTALAPRPQTIRPNAMQREALANLARLREGGASRALLVSATGTGKTYLAAFDVRQMGARRALFVVHRERIARDALASFARVIGAHRSYGLCVGSTRDASCDFVFATFQTLSRHLSEFAPGAFDYLVVDEAHHAGAGSYTRILSHFSPAFTLGMTATAVRGDGLDVFALFDNNIAYQIGLQRAEAEGMLAPFHYFGIHDLEVDGVAIEEESSFARLTSEARVAHLTAEIERYAVDPVRRGLVFCSRVDEARELSRLFNERGWRTVALDGTSSDAEREQAIERLECERVGRDDWLELIFCRDIFNEGVDIPSLNLVVMCRPTDSATVFVQQLGRGLRKVEGKDYVLVLDFIGNYRKSYLIPIALSGDRTYNKDNIRRFVREGNRIIEGCSTIHFDEVSERHIYQMLDQERFSTVKLIREEYTVLRKMLGRIPTLSDFRAHGAIDPQLIFARLGSYHAFLAKYERDYHVRMTSVQEQMLRFVSQKLASGKRVQDLLMLKAVIADAAVDRASFERMVRARSAALPVAFDSCASVLDGTFLTGAQATSTFRDATFVEERDGELRMSSALRRALANPEFARQLAEVVDYGIARFEDSYAQTYRDTSLVLYQKYTYEDVCRVLGWSKCLSGQNIGGYKYDKETNTFPVFINYEKGADVSDSTRYHDRFLSPRRLIAISKSNRRLDSPDIERLRRARETGMRTYLFVRKNKDDAESKEFYFLGSMEPTGSFVPFVMEGAGKPAVEIEYDLDVPVADELFDYLTEGDR